MSRLTPPKISALGSSALTTTTPPGTTCRQSRAFARRFPSSSSTGNPSGNVTSVTTAAWNEIPSKQWCIRASLAISRTAPWQRCSTNSASNAASPAALGANTPGSCPGGLRVLTELDSPIANTVPSSC